MNIQEQEDNKELKISISELRSLLQIDDDVRILDMIDCVTHERLLKILVYLISKA